MSLVNGVITEWGRDDNFKYFNEVEKEIINILNKHKLSLSETRGLFNHVLFDIETKNIVNL